MQTLLVRIQTAHIKASRECHDAARVEKSLKNSFTYPSISS
jgi:hypothetical protein